MSRNEVITAYTQSPLRPWHARFFPVVFCGLPEAPAAFKDVLEVHSHVFLDWKDRLRALVSGRLMVHTRVVCQNEIGLTVPKSVVYVEPPIFKPSRFAFLTVFWTHKEIRAFIELALFFLFAWIALYYLGDFYRRR